MGVCVIVLMYILTTILSCPATACTVGAYINNGRRCSRENHEAEKTREISEREEEKKGRKAINEREEEKRRESIE